MWSSPADAQGQTGCTVLLAPGGAVAGVDVRGGAPGTINTDGLRPGTVTEQAQAILLTGGSTFGLSATSGVLRYLEERGIGLNFGSVAVPIVAGAVIFDLAGDPAARPGPAYCGARGATASPDQGAVGAGTGPASRHGQRAAPGRRGAGQC
jgi:L-aminopeptidase/D-esterase-like protein